MVDPAILGEDYHGEIPRGVAQLGNYLSAALPEVDDLVDLNSAYQTPLSGTYGYLYDRDRRLKQINFPSGRQIRNIYGSCRLAQIQTPEGNVDFSYLCGSKVGTISRTGEAISYGYDGPLLTSEIVSGTLNQALGYTYNNDFNVTGITYAGGTVGYAYDNDGLLVGSGAFTITRDAGNGLPVSLVGGTLTLGHGFNGYGELDQETTTVSGHNVSSWSLGRDNAGRITSKTETVGAVTSNYAYTYDPMGRLRTVTKNGSLVEEYQYDTNGRRSFEFNALRGIAGRNFGYSIEDHLLTVGDAAYQYDLDGFLTAKTRGPELTQYFYSDRGELLGVILPNGTVVEYVHDPLGRRIAKKVNGVIVEKYLWQGMTRLLAVYDGSNNLVMRLQYADGRMPVAMIAGPSTYYLSYDQVGTLRAVSDVAGNVVKRIDYDSFGNILADTNPAFLIPFGFAGGLHDRDTGLVRFGFRDYDPNVGRWAAKDPLEFDGDDTDLYSYVSANPLSYVDPLGLFFRDTNEAHFWKNIMRGDFEEASLSFPHVEREFAEKAIRAHGNEIVKALKNACRGSSARSGQAGTPYKQAGAELIREGNRIGGEMGELFKQVGRQLMERGKGFSHK